MAMGLRKRRRLQLIGVGFAMIFATAALIGFAFKDGIQYFRSPTQVLAAQIAPDEVFRIGGLVADGSIQKQGEVTRFQVTDGGAHVDVIFTGILPDLFAENSGMIAQGTYDGSVFQAVEILAKHDEQYMPREVADALKEQGIFKGDPGPEQADANADLSGY